MATTGDNSFRSHFYWLAFIGFSVVVSEASKRAVFFHAIRAPLLDVLANYAVLGILVVGTAVIAAAALQLGEALIGGSYSRTIRLISDGAVFTVFVVSWVNIWYGAVSGLLPVALRTPMIGRVAIGFSVAAIGLLVFRDAVPSWLRRTSGHLEAFVLILTGASVALCTFFWLQPFREGTVAPVKYSVNSSRPPNVIIIVLDTLRAQDMSAYGYSRPTTPNLDELSNSWTVYENAHSTGNGTPAVLPTLLTGRYYYLDEGYRYGDLTRASDGWMSAPGVLRQAKYQNAYFGAVGSLFMPGRYHLNTAFDRILGGKPFPGRELLLDRSVWLGVVGQMDADYRAFTGLPAGTEESAISVSLRDERPEPMYGVVEKYLADQSSGLKQSFFAVFHMFRPHFPFVADDLMGTFLPVNEGLTNIDGQTRLMGRHMPPMSQVLADKLRLRYDENILKADAQVGHLIRTLKQLGLYDQSLIVVVADHGVSISREYSGAYNEALPLSEHRIPLLVKYPGQTSGRRVTALVSNVDIMPTILDVVGISYPAGWVDGISLRKAGEEEGRIVFVRQVGEGSVLQNPTIAAISGDLKLVDRQGRLLLFNMRDDPDEERDLLSVTDSTELQHALRQFVLRKAAINEGRPMNQTPSLIDHVTATRLAVGTKASR